MRSCNFLEVKFAARLGHLIAQWHRHREPLDNTVLRTFLQREATKVEVMMSVCSVSHVGHKVFPSLLLCSGDEHTAVRVF